MSRTIDHIIRIDLISRRNLHQTIKIRKNDINSHKFVITINYNSVAFDLTGKTAKIYFQKPDFTKLHADCIIDNALRGNVSYLLETKVLSCVGVVVAQIVIYGNNGQIVTSISLRFTVMENTAYRVADENIKGGLFVNVLDCGAKGDGSTDDTKAIQNCINKAPSTGVIFFPSTGSFYNVTNITIPKEKNNLKLLGTGMVHSYICFSSPIGISIQAEGVHIDSLRIKGAGIYTSNSYIFKDERLNNRADFDITIRNCFILEAETVVFCRGRGVIIEFCAFYAIRYQIIKANFPLLKGFQPGPEDIQTYKSGFRGFIFRDNRVHYSPCEILNNVGENKMNLSGVLITGNQLEGSTGYIEGYVRNCEISNNIHYHSGNVREALIILHGCDNVNIELNVSGKKKSNEGVDSYSNKIVQCTGKYNNLTIKANIQDVYKDVFYFNAGGENLDIQVNASNICIEETSQYSLVRLDNKEAVYDGINIRGTIRGAGPNFIAVKRCDNLVRNHNINLNIIGDFLLYNNLDSCEPSIRKTTSGVYLGDGTTNRQITIKYKPALIQVFSNDFLGVKSIGTNILSPNITINDSGFTVTLAANMLNETYVYIVQ